jgi:hypothetical protein
MSIAEICLSLSPSIERFVNTVKNKHRRDDFYRRVTLERLRQARRRHAEMFRRAIEAGLPLDKALDEAERVFDAEAARE